MLLGMQSHCSALGMHWGMHWGGYLSSRVRAFDFIVSIHNVAVECAFEPRGGR